MAQGFLLSPSLVPGVVEARPMTANYEAGDAQFLETGTSRRAQLRPVLASEQTPRPFGPADRLLVVSTKEGMELRAYVQLPPRRRKNTVSNVNYAIRRVGEYDAVLGAMLRQAADGRL